MREFEIMWNKFWRWLGFGRGLLTYEELVELVDQGVITADYANINAASIDITLDDVIAVEDNIPRIVDLANKESINYVPVRMDENGYLVHPGQFFLGSSREYFNLPDDIVAEFVLKSSQARNGLGHLLAGYADPGWHGSKLTTEYKNENEYHTLRIRPGMKAGQLKFYRVKKVPKHASYSVVGRYNNQTAVTASKGIR